MDVIPTQHTLHDVNTHFLTCLHDYLTNALTDGTLLHFIAIFCDPHDVKPVVKSRMSGFGIAHDLLS